MDSPKSEQSQTDKLLKTYTVENLTRITSTLIELYKEKNYATLKNIAHSISEHTGLNAQDEITNQSRYFSRLIIMYHPDKINSYHKTINQAENQSGYDALKPLNHIFTTMELIANHKKNAAKQTEEGAYYQEDNFVPDPELYADLNNYVFDISELEEANSADGANSEYNDFYDNDELDNTDNMDIDRELDSFYNLEGKSFEEIYSSFRYPDKTRLTMIDVQMNNLDGIEKFTGLSHLDLSRNQLNDIYHLCVLDKLEELCLSDNNIYNLFPLSTLKSLRVLDLASNQIDDISYLFKLNNLEFVNLIGNPISDTQIDRLKKQVKLVLF